MTFWRQGSNDSLNDKLVRPRSSSSYWDRKPQSNEAESIVETPLEEAQDVFSDVSEEISETAETVLEDTKDDITKAVEEIFPEEAPASLDADLPEIPELQVDDAALEDVDLDIPASLEEIEALPEIETPEAIESAASSLESLSIDQDEETDLEDDDADALGAPPTFFDDEVVSSDDTDNLDIPDLDVKELETPNLETQELVIPELDEAEPVAASSDQGKMPPVIPASGHASGNAAHKYYDEEEFRENDSANDSESEEVAVLDPVSDLEEIDTTLGDDNVSHEQNESGQVIAFPPSHQSSPHENMDDIAASAEKENIDDGLTEEEKLAVSLSAGAAAAHSTSGKNSQFSARVAKPKTNSPIVTPRQTAASYYDEDEQVYEAGFESDDGYYVPSQENSDGSGRRIALYLAGAASISAICAAVYFMLPKGSEEQLQTADAGNDVAPTLPDITTRDASTSTTEANAATSTDAPLNDARVFSDLIASGTEETDSAISTPSDDLFASAEAGENITDVPAPETARELSPNTTTLASPDLKSPDVSAPKVAEEAPRLTLSKPAETVETVDVVPAPKANDVTPPPVATVDTPSVSTPSVQTPPPPKAAPKLAKRNIFSGSSSVDQTPKRVRAPKILRSSTAKAVAPIALTVGERVYDGIMRAGSMPQTIIDSLFANGAYLSSKEQKQFAYNVRHAAKTTRDGEVNSIVTQNGTRVDLHFLNTQNEVRPTFVTRSDNIEPLPRYMLLQDDWARVVTPTQLFAAPRQYDQKILRNLPLSTTVERMGSITDSSGEQWSMVGQKGVAIGYVPSASLTSLADTGAQTIRPFTTSISNNVIERIDVSVPCRDYTMSTGGTGTMHSACMTPDGDWMTKEGAKSGLSFTSAPTTPLTSTVPTRSSVSTVTPVTKIAPIATTAPTVNSISSAQRSSLSKEAEAILFQPETLRRDARHGMGSASERIGSLFGQSSLAKAVSISTPDGRIGQLAFDEKAGPTKTAQANQIALTSGLVKLDKQVRLMNAPEGSVVSEADTIMRGEVLEAISVSQTPNGESWTLLGENGVGYGYVLTDYTSDAPAFTTATSERYDGFNNAAALGGSPKSSTNTVEQAELPAGISCQTATYATGGETGVLKACLQPNGMWTAEVQPSTSYDIRATAHLDHLQGGSNLW